MIVLHHLNFSRSSRIICALEELGLDYRIEHYERDANFRAPPALAKVHRLGKAPVIADGDLVIAESAVILAYLNDMRGDGRLAPKAGTIERVAHDEWLDFVESTFAFPVLMSAIAMRAGGLGGGMEAFAKDGSKRMFAQLETALAEGGPFITGAAFTLADIQFSYVLEVARTVGMLDDHPVVTGYLDRTLSRDSFIRALEIGGPMAPPRR